MCAVFSSKKKTSPGLRNGLAALCQRGTRRALAVGLADLTATAGEV